MTRHSLQNPDIAASFLMVTFENRSTQSTVSKMCTLNYPPNYRENDAISVGYVPGLLDPEVSQSLGIIFAIK